jgi:hypothetical protein
MERVEEWRSPSHVAFSTIGAQVVLPRGSLPRKASGFIVSVYRPTIQGDTGRVSKREAMPYWHSNWCYDSVTQNLSFVFSNDRRHVVSRERNGFPIFFLSDSIFGGVANKEISMQ